MLVEVCREYFPDFAAGLDDPRVTIYYQNGLRFYETVRMITISLSTMRQIHLDIRKGSLPRNFTETVTEP